ncbi:MAG: enoyl-CoA hydratase-related protein, partial [Ilumatobacteraceae bacterium]
MLSVTIDRPETRNAVDLDTLRSIETIMNDLDDARVVVLSGAPPAFCSGADLTGVELGEFTDTLQR